ncbi:MAG TPA: hydrogenase maturation protease [Verrucomicrobiae bacterium]|nr:hydrogenase maturation protease [Verrucomicrobiae bacterium]
MGELSANEPFRVLCLGNDILADDAFGPRVAAEVKRRCGESLEVVCSAASGLHLLDDVLGAGRLLVIDTVMTPDGTPGRLRVFREGQVQVPSGAAPHAYGLFDVLRHARKLGLPVPWSVIIIAVEAADCGTVGGPMTPAVEQAVGKAADMVRGICHV